MTQLPSKELLREVLGDEYIERVMDLIIIEGNVLQSLYDCGKGTKTCLGYEINLYELAHKCKEWAALKNSCNDDLNNGNHFYINDITTSFIAVSNVWQSYVGYRGIDKDGDWRDLQITFTEKTEPEAIFQACQWILDSR